MTPAAAPALAASARRPAPAATPRPPRRAPRQAPRPALAWLPALAWRPAVARRPAVGTPPVPWGPRSVLHPPPALPPRPAPSGRRPVLLPLPVFLSRPAHDGRRSVVPTLPPRPALGAARPDPAGAARALGSTHADSGSALPARPTKARPLRGAGPSRRVLEAALRRLPHFAAACPPQPGPKAQASRPSPGEQDSRPVRKDCRPVDAPKIISIFQALDLDNTRVILASSEGIAP